MSSVAQEVSRELEDTGTYMVWRLFPGPSWVPTTRKPVAYPPRPSFEWESEADLVRQIQWVDTADIKRRRDGTWAKLDCWGWS